MWVHSDGRKGRAEQNVSFLMASNERRKSWKSCGHLIIVPGERVQRVKEREARNG